MKKKNKGSSLIMVLVVTLLIITLGSVALSMSLSNVRMSSKVRDYNKEYYDIEKAAEEVLEKIDIELKICEDNAISYLKEEKFRKGSEAYKEDYIKDLKYPAGNQMFLNNRWEEEVFKKSLFSKDSQIVNPVLYEDNFQKYFQESFNRLYFSYAQNSISSFVNSFHSKYSNKNITCNIKLKKNETKNYNKAIDYREWDKFDLNSGDLNLELTFKNSVGRVIKGEISIIPPHYTAAAKEEKKTYRANPIWTNALVSNGDIIFKQGKFTLSGDLVAMNEKGSNIIFTNNVQLNSFGNMLASNEIVFQGEKNTVTVDKGYSGSNVEFKKSLFGNEYLFKDDEIKVFPRDITAQRPNNLYEDGDDVKNKNYMPMFFNDITGGNVYCSNLTMGVTSENSKMKLRNLLVADAVELKSIGNSEISITNLLIGTGRGHYGEAYLEDPKTLNNGNKFILPENYITNRKFQIKTYEEVGSKSNFENLTATNIYTDPDNNSTRIENPLYNVLLHKTTKLGTLDNTFSNMVFEAALKGQTDPSVIKMIYYNGNKDLVLNNDETKNSIIYCNGDLNIKGKGTINGVVIAKGNITLEGDIKIKYDETVIKNTLRDSIYAEKFFSIGETGFGISLGVDSNNKEIKGRETTGTNPKAMKRIGKDRYNIVKWNRN